MFTSLRPSITRTAPTSAVFNARGPIVALASGQAVVHYRVAIMSKDGDWIIRETAEACTRVLQVLAERGASYRPGAPLDTRWLAGGWSSHFEFTDEKNRRVRCDFFSRPPRIAPKAVDALFTSAAEPFLVVDLESLIRMKRTQRAKDYAVIGELAAQLPPRQELRFTTDADRILRLAPKYGVDISRAAVQAALTGNRDAVVIARISFASNHSGSTSALSSMPSSIIISSQKLLSSASSSTIPILAMNSFGDLARQEAR